MYGQRHMNCMIIQKFKSATCTWGWMCTTKGSVYVLSQHSIKTFYTFLGLSYKNMFFFLFLFLFLFFSFLSFFFFFVVTYLLIDGLQPYHQFNELWKIDARYLIWSSIIICHVIDILALLSGALSQALI